MLSTLQFLRNCQKDLLNKLCQQTRRGSLDDHSEKTNLPDAPPFSGNCYLARRLSDPGGESLGNADAPGDL
jgi:hypothetical protein